MCATSNRSFIEEREEKLETPCSLNTLQWSFKKRGGHDVQIVSESNQWANDSHLTRKWWESRVGGCEMLTCKVRIDADSQWRSGLLQWRPKCMFPLLLSPSLVCFELKTLCIAVARTTTARWLVGYTSAASHSCVQIHAVSKYSKW